MKHLHKLKRQSFLKWDSSKSHQTPIKSIYNLAKNIEKDDILDQGHSVTKAPRLRKPQIEAQIALLTYLNETQNLPFPDAEHISQNCPSVIDKLLKKVKTDQEIVGALTRYFRYNPINEFEPFYESIGLRPSEIDPILPRDLMFLKDDPLLLENYHTLCNYGVLRSLIGKFYREVSEIFRYDYGVLDSKLRALEDLGFCQYSVVKFVATSPSLLIGKGKEDILKTLDLLRSFGIELKWIETRLSDKNFYDWSHMLGFLSFVCEMRYSEADVKALVKRNPGVLLDGSGSKAFCLVGFLLKFGSTREDISSFLVQFPRVQVGTFMKNLRQCVVFFKEIRMHAKDIGKIVRAHPLLLGSCSLKQTITITLSLKVGKQRLCNIVKEDPYQLKNWILGLRLKPLPNSGGAEKSLMQKTEFLLNIGFIENSDEMKKALKVFRGRGSELQDRFDCLLKAGLKRETVVAMIKKAPHALNQSKDVIEEKIDFLVNGLCYPISTLEAFPSYISYTIERVNLRFSMYTWLKDEGVVAPMLHLSTILASSNKIFMQVYVNRHPRGLEVWENLKKQYCV